MSRLLASFLLLAVAYPPPTEPSPHVKLAVRIRKADAGWMGGIAALISGGGADSEGMLQQEAILGQRFKSGLRIVDLATHTSLQVDTNRYASREEQNKQASEFVPLTFLELQERLQQGRQTNINAARDAARHFPTSGPELPRQSKGRAKTFEYVVDVQMTSTRRQIAGLNATLTKITLTAVEAGTKLDQNGGWMVTSDVWVGPRVPDIDRFVAAQEEFHGLASKGVFDGTFYGLDVSEAARFDGEFPELTFVAGRLMAEFHKLDGTVLAQKTTYQIGRSAEGVKRAEAAERARQQEMGGVRVLGDSPLQFAKILILDREIESIDTNVTDRDVAIPAGYTLRKK